MNTVEARLCDRGLEIPAPAPSSASYVPVLQVGNLIYVSGQLPMRDGKLAFQGVVEWNLGTEDARKAAELCLLNIFGQLKAYLGSLEGLRCVRLGGFVQSRSSFREHASVLNGASDLLIFALGDRGKHVRAAVGCSSLPLNAAVEVEAIFQIDDPGHLAH
ncbi:RidA family protein [Afipia birgiae]|jgi:enamine deaminase RidA (YjgF/YER057c/UK114 family)|uniref:RidA family protein n=1 Tax=Afipia birgiae TaxID=151414 RepID=UPI00058C355E|nr:RidA family protein [Afipia birgiae]MBX9822420.1 RidA family protein [Afipia birgiae]